MGVLILRGPDLTLPEIGSAMLAPSHIGGRLCILIAARRAATIGPPRFENTLVHTHGRDTTHQGSLTFDTMDHGADTFIIGFFFSGSLFAPRRFQGGPTYARQ